MTLVQYVHEDVFLAQRPVHSTAINLRFREDFMTNVTLLVRKSNFGKLPPFIAEQKLSCQIFFKRKKNYFTLCSVQQFIVFRHAFLIFSHIIQIAKVKELKNVSKYIFLPLRFPVCSIYCFNFAALGITSHCQILPQSHKEP